MLFALWLFDSRQIERYLEPDIVLTRNGLGRGGEHYRSSLRSSLSALPFILQKAASSLTKAVARSLPFILVVLRPVYTCDFWCDFWCDFAYKARLTLPCTNIFFVKYRVDWKESYHILFQDTLPSPLVSPFCASVQVSRDPLCAPVELQRKNRGAVNRLCEGWSAEHWSRGQQYD